MVYPHWYAPHNFDGLGIPDCYQNGGGYAVNREGLGILEDADEPDLKPNRLDELGDEDSWLENL